MKVEKNIPTLKYGILSIICWAFAGSTYDLTPNSSNAFFILQLIKLIGIGMGLVFTALWINNLINLNSTHNTSCTNIKGEKNV